MFKRLGLQLIIVICWLTFILSTYIALGTLIFGGWTTYYMSGKVYDLSQSIDLVQWILIILSFSIYASFSFLVINSFDVKFRRWEE